MLLAGDIGGTKTRVACYETANGRLESVVEESFPSREFASLEEIVERFVGAHRVRLDGAGFGVAGPVRGGRVMTTNLPWLVDSKLLAEVLDLPRVALINDLEATASGIGALDESDFATLNRGDPSATGNIAVIAAGTGLGEAGLYWDGQRHHVFASEGGHADFAPRNELEQALLTYLMSRWDHVSYERVLSGPGLRNVYDFLRDTARGEEPAWLAEEMRLGDPAAAISRAALAGRSDLAGRALDLFVRIYGAEAGNLALKVMATGGLYIGGGIAPKILPRLREGAFLHAFSAKGRLQGLMEAIPVRVVLNDRAALLGAALAAESA